METLMAGTNYSEDPKLVLVVDDHSEVRDVLSVVLNVYGYQTLEACNGNEAMVVYEANPIDLVITDIFMPEKDGLSLIEELKQLNPDAKIIAMSGCAQNELPGCLEWAKSLGAVGAFTKPFNHLVFLDVVQKALHVGSHHAMDVSAMNAASGRRVEAYHN